MPARSALRYPDGDSSPGLPPSPTRRVSVRGTTVTLGSTGAHRSKLGVTPGSTVLVDVLSLQFRDGGCRQCRP